MQNKVEIITIGDEILIGQIVDTNSAFMASNLDKSGFRTVQISSVADDETQIISAIDTAFERADIVLLTGGIGPTKDDITKRTLCRIFDCELVFSAAVLENIESLYASRPRVMNELTRSQAFVPVAATVIQNNVGSAPLTWFERNGKVLVSMPGVPYEMENAMLNEIIPRLQKHFQTPGIIHRTLITAGIPESELALRIADWENALPAFLRLAYLPQWGIVKLRLSGSHTNKEELQKIMIEKIAALRQILGNDIVANEDTPFEMLLGELLKNKNLTISTAESCTGGNIASRLTSIAGCSAYFKGSVVSYANEVKTKVLGITEKSLEQFGAVSQAVVEQMANGVREFLDTDIAIATSGIAGPDGGTAEKPVGTIWIAVCSREHTESRCFHFSNRRLQNIETATLHALLMAKRFLD